MPILACQKSFVGAVQSHPQYAAKKRQSVERESVLVQASTPIKIHSKCKASYITALLRAWLIPYFSRNTNFVLPILTCTVDIFCQVWQESAAEIFREIG